MFWAFENGIFQFFANFWVTKLKLFSGKARQSVQSYLNPKFVKKSILENSFQAALRWKASVLRVQIWYFSLFFSKFSIYEVKTVYWESETKLSKLLKFKVSLRNHFKRWFWNYIKVKNECSESWKMTFSTFLQIFE